MMPQQVVPMLTALGNQDGLPASPLVLGPPHPCKKNGSKADELQGHFHTGSPRATYAYTAPAMDGTSTYTHLCRYEGGDVEVGSARP